MSTPRLQHRVAIVTGGAQGIGAAYAQALAQHGAKVCIADLLDGNAVVQAIQSNGGQAIYQRCDVTDSASV